MKVLTLMVEFHGRGTPMDRSPGFAISEAVGPVRFSSGEASGEARMKTVVYTNDGHFWEAGEIAFPELDAWLVVDTVTPGRVQQRADGSSYGSITWRVVSGGGPFAAVQGIVTGNFIGDATGGFVDHQVYNLLLAR